MSTPSTDPIRAEALGEEFVTATHLGRQWRIPADVDTWPLTAITHSIGVTADRTILVNHIAVAEAIAAILGDQWEQFVELAPRRRDLVPASQVFAAAAGIPAGTDIGPDGNPQDRAFGAIPRMLAVLDTWPDAVESDLHRFWGIDYRDRWRFNDDGRRRLTLRQIHARLSHLPAESALAITMGRRSPTELLLMDIYEPLAGRAHPARPLTPEQIAERNAEAMAKAKARAEYEARRIAQGHRRVTAGLENARANALRGR